MHLTQPGDGLLQFLLVADRFRCFLRKAECLGLVQGRDEPVDARRHEDRVLDALEHVLTLGVGERGVVDDVDAMPHAHLHRLGAASVGADALAAAVRLGDRGGDLLVGEVRVLSTLGAGDLLARHGQLDLVDAETDEFPDGLTHTLRAVGELGDRMD